jgi:hypothetical protein
MEFKSTPKENKILLGLVVGVIAIFGFVYLEKQLGKESKMKRGCDCSRILNVPTFKVSEYGSPLPIDHMSNEDFRKYEACLDEFAGIAGATLTCGGR